MRKEVKFIISFVIVLCMILGTAVFATADTPDMSTQINPETGEILQEAPTLGDEGQIMPISEELLPISDDMLRGDEVYLGIEPITDEVEEDDDDNNIWLWVGAGVAVVVIIAIIAVIMKKR